MVTLTRNSRLLTIAFCLVWITGCHKRSELSGTWVMQWADELQESDVPAALRPKWILTLNDDGTFTQQVENHIMVTLVMNSRGKYMRSGDVVTLTGTSESYSDDGYRKGTRKEPLTMKFRYAENTLTMVDAHAGDGNLVLRRPGDKAPPKPKPQPKPSDPGAVRIVREMQRRYATLDTYSDEGTLTSSGAGFMAENARFQTRFSRPHKFRFQFEEIADGKVWRTHAFWSDGKKSWVYWEDAGYRHSIEEDLGRALSSSSPALGPAVLVPSLLLPAEFCGSMIDGPFRELSLVGEQKVSGKECYVVGIGLSDPEGWGTKLWVDKSSYLILRTFERKPNATTIYRPKPHTRIAEAEFLFSPPK